ncbi:hypothetical protein ACFX13_037531 [Malus domestica]
MRQQGSVPSSVISSHCMHLGVLATAWHAILTGTMFTVYYKPRTSPAEFIVPFDQYMESVENNYSIGMRFKMRFEGEEAPLLLSFFLDAKYSRVTFFFSWP